MPGGTTSQGEGSGKHWDVKQGIIDDPDPVNLIQRISIHGDKIKVIDNIPIEAAKNIFEDELHNTKKAAILKLRNKAKNNLDYEPTDAEIEIIKDLIKNPAGSAACDCPSNVKNRPSDSANGAKGNITSAEAFRLSLAKGDTATTVSAESSACLVIAGLAKSNSGSTPHKR